MTTFSCPDCGETKQLEVLRFYDGGAKVQLTCRLFVHEEPVVRVVDDPDSPKLDPGEDTIVGQLDLYTKLEEVVASLDRPAEHGVVEHLFAQAYPADYRALWERFGHIATHGPKRYTLSAYLGLLLGNLSRQGGITHVPCHGTGRWAYNADIGGWKHATRERDDLLTWEQFAVAAGIDPSTWPVTAGFPNVEQDSYWAYDNWVHKYTKVHRGDCSFCNDGAGMHGAEDSEAGEWIGPYDDLASMRDRTERTGHPVSPCGTCMAGEWS